MRSNRNIKRLLEESGFSSQRIIADADAESSGSSQPIVLRKYYKEEENTNSLINMSAFHDGNMVNDLEPFITFSRHLVQIQSFYHHLQDVIKLGVGAGGWQGCWLWGVFISGSAADSQTLVQYTGAQCVIPGIGAMITLLTTYVLSQWVLSRWIGDTFITDGGFLTAVLLQLPIPIILGDSFWQPVWDLVANTTDNYFDMFLLAYFAYHLPALLFSSAQNLAYKLSNNEGFYSDNKFTAKVVMAYTGFGAASLLASPLNSIFHNEATSSIVAAMITTGAGAAIAAVGQHQATMKEFDKCAEKDRQPSDISLLELGDISVSPRTSACSSGCILRSVAAKTAYIISAPCTLFYYVAGKIKDAYCPSPSLR